MFEAMVQILESLGQNQEPSVVPFDHGFFVEQSGVFCVNQSSYCQSNYCYTAMLHLFV